MMNALPQPAASPALATFLAAIGQAPATGGEQGSFSQLLAAAPQPGAISVPAQPLSGEGANLPAATVIAAETPAQPTTTPVAKPATAPADSAAATAASLLIAIAGAGATATETKAAPALPTDPNADGDASGDPVVIAMFVAEPAAPATPAAAGWTPVVVAPPATGKPAKPVEAAAASVGDMVSTAPGAAKTAVAPTPTFTAIPVEAPAAKSAPADSAASMTVLFAQPAAQGAAAIADVPAPAIIAERTLDLGSDDAWIEQLAHDIAATKSTTGDISFRLMPRHLGRLDIAMRQGDEGVSLTLDTRHEATATIVTGAQARLVEDLRQQGVRVASAEVTCTPGETGRQSQNGQGRGTAPDTAHLIETATERAEPRSKNDNEDRAADRRGRFA